MARWVYYNGSPCSCLAVLQVRTGTGGLLCLDTGLHVGARSSAGEINGKIVWKKGHNLIFLS